jgi:AraC family transcriptional regulator
MTRAAGAVCGAFGRVALIDIAQPIKPHAHPHAHLLFKVGGADSLFRVRGRFVPMTDDTVVLVNPWEPHDYPRHGVGRSSLVLGLYIEPAWLEAMDRRFASGRQAFPHACVPAPARVRSLLHDLADAVRQDPIPPQAHEALLASILCELARPAGAPAGGRDFRVRRAIEFMRTHVRDPHAMSEVAKQSGLSRAHFFELFRTHAGVTPLLFFHALRMEAAYEALLCAHASLAEISTALGFAAPPHFTRFFRDHLGATPSDFRRAALSP